MDTKFNPDLIRVYVGVDRSQMVGFEVLKYSIEKHTSRPVSVYPMLDLNLPEPKDKRNVQRTGFSFSRFAIPQLAGYQGKAIYMDADMQVFTDIGKLWDTPFDGKKILIQKDLPPERVDAVGSKKPRKRIKQCAVSLLDCERLKWDPEGIISGLDGKYNYEELLYHLCILKESEVGYVLPFEWNSLEYWDENTCNIHYTDMHSQPWVSPVNRFGWVWINEVKEMLEKGALTWDELENEVKLGYARPSLLTELKLNEDLSIPNESRTKKLQKIDKDAGFVMHKEVYDAKRQRQKAEKEYLAKLAAEKAKKPAHILIGQIKKLFSLSGKKRQELHQDTKKRKQFGARIFDAERPLRVLYLANTTIPNLEISFTRPLEKLVDLGLIKPRLLTEQDLKEYSKLSVDRAAKMKELFNAVWKEHTPDLVVSCRYSGPLSDTILNCADQNGVPVILYLDDDLLNVPKELGKQKFEYHSNPKRLAAVQKFMERADIIYSSTEELTKRIKSYGVATKIMTAEVFCAGYEFPNTVQPSETVFGYMGFGHGHDLEITLPGIVKLLERRADLTFELFGSIPKPKELEVFGDRVVMRPPVRSSYKDFMEEMNRLNWAVGITPLADLPFNKFKANTKWVEYSTAGIAVVSNDHVAYREAIKDDCGLIVRQGEDWGMVIERLLDDSKLRDFYVANAQKKVKEYFNIDRLEMQVLKLFGEVGINFRQTKKQVA